MRQLVTMRHPIGFILFGALVAVVVQPAFGAIVGSRIQAEGMTESSSDIAVQDDGAGDEGDHLRFANSATSSQRASITVNPGQQVDEIQIRSRACYELGRKSHRNADSTVSLVPSRSPFPAFLSRY